jgi:basic membrane protein A and related proteins
VKARRWLPWFAVALIGALAAAGAGYGSSGGHKAKAAKSVRLAIVTDIGGLNDHGFNQLANKGRLAADRLPGVSTRVYTSKSQADYTPNLLAASQNADLVIGVGFLMEKELGTISKRFPKVKYGGIDEAFADTGGGTNVRGLLFAEQQAGCLVADLAARLIKGKGKQVLSAIGGQKVPAVDHYIAGYRYCAKKANSKVTVNYDYSQSFTDVAKCKDLALNQIAAGSRVVFAVAGGCGVGALDAAKDKKVWGIGVDADQAYLGPQVLTSALKRVDTAVFDTVKLYQSGKFKGGVDQRFTAANGGVGEGKIAKAVPKKVIAQNKLVLKQLASGKLKPPSTL